MNIKTSNRMKTSVCIAISIFLFCINNGFAQKGKDGAKIVSASNTIVNEYTALTANASAGASSITVTNSGLNSNGRFAGSLTAGDLIMIIQMQGATINGAPNDSTWGAVTNYNNCGQYEFAEVAGVPNATTIDINCSLKHDYTASGKVQVVRVPRYSSLMVNAGAGLITDPWNGQQRGIIVVEVIDNTVIDGTINASATGFRGGAITNNSGTTNITKFAGSSSDGGEKGEGIAGYENDYNIYGGGFCRGAAANAGGGGNSNAAGGGGSNAGDISAWTGNGNPDVSTPSWIAAWNLEYSGFATSTSSGGGKGGHTASATNQNALIVPPGDGSWGYDDSRNIGGKGGRPLDYSTGRIFLGGGGGAGGANNSVGGAGGNGGGIVYVLSYGTINGSGSLISNGENGHNDPTQGAGAEDPPGGAGGGGTVIINSTGTISGISINANGGNGGNQTTTGSEAEGGGGGGGGGYIAISNGSITHQETGGVNGITHSTSLTEFLPNGATAGGDGISATISGSPLPTPAIASAGSDTSICIGSSVTLSGSGGVTYSWNPSTGLSCNNCQGPVASPTVPTDYVVEVTNASGCKAKDTVSISLNPSPTADAGVDTSICSLQFNNTSSGAANYQWDFGDGTAMVTDETPVHLYNKVGTYNVILTAISDKNCINTTSVNEEVQDQGSTLFVPNTFTPNGDGVNDIFKVGSTALSAFEASIFNRWGEKVYSWNDNKMGWDGTTNGKTVPEGVYIYVITATSQCSGTTYDYHGIVTVLR